MGMADEQAVHAAAIGLGDLAHLSEYTDTELRQMHYKGEITRQEYEDETSITFAN